MAQTVSPEFIAADVGGTHARIARVRVEGARVQVLSHVVKQAAAASGLGELLADARGDARWAAVSIAGLVQGDSVMSCNLPWQVSARAAASEAGFEQLRLINDLESFAHALPSLQASPNSSAQVPLHAVVGEPGHRLGPQVVLGAGTGLAASVRLPDGTVLGSETGHASLAPSTARECAVVEWLLRERRYVHNEGLLSGPGLVTTYNALCGIDGVAAHHDTPAAILSAAGSPTVSSGADPQAREAVQMICELMGSLSGDLACTFNAASIHLTGGVASHLRQWLLAGGFERRFVDKGVLRPVLERTPVWLVDEPLIGVLGAAAWFWRIQQHQCETGQNA